MVRIAAALRVLVLEQAWEAHVLRMLGVRTQAEELHWALRLPVDWAADVASPLLDERRVGMPQLTLVRSMPWPLRRLRLPALPRVSPSTCA